MKQALVLVLAIVCSLAPGRVFAGISASGFEASGLAFADANCDERVSAADLTALVIAAGSGSGDGETCDPDPNGNDMLEECDLLETIAALFGGSLAECLPVPAGLQFAAMVGEEPFACGNLYTGIGTQGSGFIPADFRFYVHAVRLVTQTGEEIPFPLIQDGIWQVQDVALLDFENGTRPCNEGNTVTNTVVRGMVPPLRYDGVRFILGVPFALNHNDSATAPSPLNFTSLFWVWLTGYKFMRIDTALAPNFRLHVGSTLCEYGEGLQVAFCARPNRAEIRLDGFDPLSGVIVADLAALFQDSDLESNHPNTAAGCESAPDDLDCEPMFRNLGIVFADGSPSPETQTFFRAEPPSSGE